MNWFLSYNFKFIICGKLYVTRGNYFLKFLEKKKKKINRVAALFYWPEIEKKCEENAFCPFKLGSIIE